MVEKRRAIEAIAPELIPVLEAGKAIARRRESAAPIVFPEQNVVFIPPREREPLVKLGRDRVSIRKKAGLTIVEPIRAPGLDVKEIFGIMVLAAAGTGAYVERDRIKDILEGKKPSVGVSWHWWPPGVY